MHEKGNNQMENLTKLLTLLNETKQSSQDICKSCNYRNSGIPDCKNCLNYIFYNKLLVTIAKTKKQLAKLEADKLIK